MATTHARLASQVPSEFCVPRPVGRLTSTGSPLSSNTGLPALSCALNFLLGLLPTLAQSLPLGGPVRLLVNCETVVVCGSRLLRSATFPEWAFGSCTFLTIGLPELSSLLGSMVLPSVSWNGLGTTRLGLIANGGQAVRGLPSLSERCL